MPANFKNASGFTMSPMQGHAGNLSIARLSHTFNGSDKSGDVFRLGRFGFNKAYVKVEVISKVGLGKATVDIGLRSIESGEYLPEYFLKAQKVPADECVGKCGEWNLRDFYERCACEGSTDKPPCEPDKGEMHEIMLRLNGEAPENACISVRVYYEDNR